MRPRSKLYVAMLRTAAESPYAIGAFNMDSLDVLGLLARRVGDSRSQAVFQFGPWNFTHLPIAETAAVARVLTASHPGCFVHLDHCTELEVLRECAEAGFDSVMMDGSHLPREENIELTREAVRLGHAAGAAVEGALGRMEHGADTDPRQAARFVEQTGVDALAVAIGTGHGEPRTPDQIDLKRLAALRAAGVPLVIHGGSGLPPEVMDAVRNSAVAKINIATACYSRAQAAVRRACLESQATGRLSALALVAAEAFWQVMRERMALMGSLGRGRAS